MKHLYLVLLLIIPATIKAQSVSDFTLNDENTGKTVSLSDFTGSKVVVVIFTSNVCPYSVYYEGRITQLISDYSGKDVQFLLINAHKEEKESAEEMANKIQTWGLSVPYLADKEQKVMQSLGARKSPEAFVLIPKGGEFNVFYKGAIDNNPQVANDVKNRFLKDNIANAITGKPATSGGRPIGCMIR